MLKYRKQFLLTALSVSIVILCADQNEAAESYSRSVMDAGGGNLWRSEEVRKVTVTEVAEAPPVKLQNVVSSTWSGQVLVNATPAFQMIQGAWFVPDVVSPMIPGSSPATRQCGKTWEVDSWIGLDGYPAGSMLLAGTAEIVTCANNQSKVSARSFVRWSPNAVQWIDKVPVTPGDYVTVRILPSGGVFILNNTTNAFASINVPKPGGIGSVGSTAEWIVGVSGTAQNPLPMAYFSYQLFSYVMATLGGYGTVDPVNPGPTQLVSLQMSSASTPLTSSSTPVGTGSIVEQSILFSASCGAPPC
jgi:hypothetical protein